MKSSQLEFCFEEKDANYYKNLVCDKLHPIIKSFMGKKSLQVYCLISYVLHEDLSYLKKTNYIKSWDINVEKINEINSNDYTFKSIIRIYPQNSFDEYLIEHLTKVEFK